MNKAFETRLEKPLKGSVILVSDLSRLSCGDVFKLQGHTYRVTEIYRGSAIINPLGH